jgi:hypothetical protein
MSDTGAATVEQPRASVQSSDAAPLPDSLGVGQGLLDAVRPSATQPMTASFANPRLQDVRAVRNGEVVTVSLNTEAFKDKPTKRDLRIARRYDIEKAMQALLGPVVRHAMNLPRVNGSVIEACRDLQGRLVTWDWWAPKKGLLISRFRHYNDGPGGRPSDEEMEHRAAWCQANKLDWMVVDPGVKLSVSDIKRALMDDEAMKEEAIQ